MRVLSVTPVKSRPPVLCQSNSNRSVPPLTSTFASGVSASPRSTGGSIVGIEIKASATISAGDFKGLKALAEAVGDRFHRGVLLYTGTEALPFGKQMHALPVSALWRIGQ